MSRGIKLDNSYQKELSAEFYTKCPKSVLAALAVSFSILQGNDAELAEEILLKEWAALHANGVVSQKPYRESKNAEDLY